jgi:hypothetical protein
MMYLSDNLPRKNYSNEHSPEQNNLNKSHTNMSMDKRKNSNG